MSELSLRMIEVVAKGLGDLRNEATFVGGAVTGIYADDPASEDARPTEDVDCVFKIVSSADYYKLEEALRVKGFQNDMESGVICRWVYKGITVDIMPTDEKILGFSNRWYKKGIERRERYELPNGDSVNVLPVAYYLATKMEAVHSRGGSDLRWSHDFEDFVFVLNGCVEIEDALKAIDDAELEEYLHGYFQELLANPNIEECIECALPLSETDRCGYLLELLNSI